MLMTNELTAKELFTLYRRGIITLDELKTAIRELYAKNSAK